MSHDIQVVRLTLFYRPILDGDQPGEPDKALFRYATNHPYAVHLLFPHRAWTFSREVLADGIDHEAGEGDVTVKHRKLESGPVDMTLRHQGEVFQARFSRDALIFALGETLRLVKFGAEHEFFDLDAELALLSGGS